MSRRALLALALAVFAISGCGDKSDMNGSSATTATGSTAATETKGQAEYKSEPPPIQILSDSTSGVHVSKPTAIVVRSDNQLRALKRRHSSAKGTTREIPPVNFADQRQVTAVFMPQSPKGALLAVTGVENNGSNTRVKVVMLLPGKGCKASGTAARPTQWVETRKLRGTSTSVEVERQRQSPC